jgi:hypothetical protein
MNVHQFITAVIAGCGLMLLGLIPGLLGSTVEAIRQFANTFAVRATISPAQSCARKSAEQSIGLAIAGAAVVLLAALAYLNR